MNSANNNIKISDGNKRNTEHASSDIPLDKRAAQRMEPLAYLNKTKKETRITEVNSNGEVQTDLIE